MRFSCGADHAFSLVKTEAEFEFEVCYLSLRIEKGELVVAAFFIVLWLRRSGDIGEDEGIR